MAKNYYLQGQHFDAHLKKVVVARNSQERSARINRVVELDCRHKDCLERRDRDGLLALAHDYQTMSMPHTARVIRLEAAKLCPER